MAIPLMALVVFLQQDKEKSSIWNYVLEVISPGRTLSSKGVYRGKKIKISDCAVIKFPFTFGVKTKIGKRPCIKHCGLLNKADLYQAYADNIMLFPSYIETIGLPLLEAQSVNALIFAADCQYARESLDGYQNAYFFHPFAPEQLAELMKQAIEGNILLNAEPKKTIRPNTKTWNVILDAITVSID